MTSEAMSAQDRITGFWSTVAAGYEAHTGNVPARDSAEYAAWVDALRDLLPPAPADVLDIATGTGFVALIAAGLGHRVTGLDLSTEMLREARAEAARRSLAITFVRDDAVAPGLPPGSFDAIVCRHFLWTLREPETALRSWLALLRPGGRAVAIDGFWFDEPGAPGEAPADGAEDLFGSYYTPETRSALPIMSLSKVDPVRDLFERAGFADVTVGSLAAIHEFAEDPPGAEPWYVVTATRD